MTSEKYHFLASRTPCERAKPPRCTAAIAQKYRRQEGESQPPTDAQDRRAVLFRLVEEHLGAEGAACEPYLLDAVWRWLISSTSTEDSGRTYASRMGAWCAGSQRRSLSAQVGTPPAAILDYLRGLEGRALAQRTVAGHRDVIRSWFGWLEERKLIERSPISREIRRGFKVDQKAMVKADGQRQALTLAEAEKVVLRCFNDVPPVECVGLLLLMVSGLRSAEVAGAGLKGLVDKDGINTLTVRGKGKKQRTITLEPIVVLAIRAYLTDARRRRTGDEHRGPLLRAPSGGHYSPRTIQSWAKAAARAIGRPEISSHDLRRTSATLLMEAGAHLHEVQEHHGHSSPALTARCYVIRRPKMVATTGLNPPTKENT